MVINNSKQVFLSHVKIVHSKPLKILNKRMIYDEEKFSYRNSAINISQKATHTSKIFLPEKVEREGLQERGN